MSIANGHAMAHRLSKRKGRFLQRAVNSEHGDAKADFRFSVRGAAMLVRSTATFVIIAVA